MVSSIKKIREKRDFDLIYKKGRSFSGRFFSLRVLAKKNQEENNFAIVVGLKISKKAVLRNYKKRQLREIIGLNKNQLKNGYFCLIIAKSGIEKSSYKELEKEFLFLCKGAGLFKD